MTKLEVYNGVINIINQKFDNKLNEFKQNLKMEAFKTFESNNDISQLKDNLNDGETWYNFLNYYIDNYIEDKLYNAE